MIKIDNIEQFKQIPAGTILISTNIYLLPKIIHVLLKLDKNRVKVIDSCFNGSNYIGINNNVTLLHNKYVLHWTIKEKDFFYGMYIAPEWIQKLYRG